MKKQIREQSPAKQNDDRAKDASIDINMELGEAELSKVSGGTCAKGQHIPKVKIIV